MVKKARNFGGGVEKWQGLLIPGERVGGGQKAEKICRCHYCTTPKEVCLKEIHLSRYIHINIKNTIYILGQVCLKVSLRRGVIYIYMLHLFVCWE